MVGEQKCKVRVHAQQAFDEALRELSPTAELVASEATAGGVYLRYRIPSPFDYDVLE